MGQKRLAHTLRTGLGAIQASIWKHREKLLTTPAGDQVLSTQLGLDKVGDFNQYPITNLMSVPVIDGLEVINIKHQERNRAPCPLEARQFLFRKLGHLAPVE